MMANLSSGRNGYDLPAPPIGELLLEEVIIFVYSGLLNSLCK